MTLPGLMQQTPLTLHTIFQRMRTIHGDGEVVSVSGSGTDRAVHRTTYAEVAERALRLARVLRDDLGVRPGDRVATFAYNSHRHLELYWAVPLVGAVLHTVNIRLFSDQIAYIVDHAGDRIVFADRTCGDQLGDVAPKLDSVERYVAMGDGPGDGLPDALDYEELLAGRDPLPFDELPDVPENAACGLCYTSGTTGMPKGVLSSHRALWLHSMSMCMTDALGIGELDRILPVVPMFHAFGWGLPYGAPFTGAELVFHGSDSSAPAVARLIADERVTVAGAVPTIWKDLLPLAQSGEADLSSLRLVFVGGSASPRPLIQAYEELGVEYLQAWGMTETGPLACTSRPRHRHRGATAEALLDVKERTGTILPGLEARIVGDHDEPQPWDGEAVGELEVRGPWIASAYYEAPGSEDRFHDGWLRTGDMAEMQHDGFVRIVDRAKDLVKSGGEWISSVELEGLLLGHPQVRDAAVIGVRSKKWDERPAAVVVARDVADPPTLESVRQWLEPQVVKWWLPDLVVVVDEIPKTSVGKLDKKVLRDQLGEVEVP